METKMNAKSILISAVALVLLSSGAEAATVADGVINACVNKKGKLRIVNSAVCKKKETLLTWNISGLLGPQGLQGEAGQQGAMGLQGEAGEQVGSQNLSPQFVGFTDAIFDGGQGVITYTNACSQEIPGSYMCTSAEVINTKAHPSALSSAMGWVKPTFMPFTAGPYTYFLDISGLTTAGSNACSGWRRTGGNTGLTVDNKGRFDSRSCNTLQSVACCK